VALGIAVLLCSSFGLAALVPGLIALMKQRDGSGRRCPSASAPHGPPSGRATGPGGSSCTPSRPSCRPSFA
jgi:hypothetical protein